MSEPSGERAEQARREPRVVLVTGGARGIGLACARAFVAAGDRVAVTYRTKPPEDDDVLAVSCDVTSTAETPPSTRSRSASAASGWWWPTPAPTATVSC
jgi:NAD(P)-dependent dehydrogenase (short-subunit alcohol dehydrogenase family)